MSSFALAAVQAHRHSGRLALRIEDLDPPRCVPGAVERHVETLRWLGIDWHSGPSRGGGHAPYRQSMRSDIYEHALSEFAARGLVYGCGCSRRDVREALSAPHNAFDPALAYPGTCRPQHPTTTPISRQQQSIRFIANGVRTFEDVVWGPQAQDIARAPGDFVVRRRDGLFAYQFAVVIDDAAMGITHVVRGVDLLQSTAAQLAIFEALGVSAPQYLHAPLLVDERGARLAKRHGPVDREALAASGWTGPLMLGALAVLWGWTTTLSPQSIEGLAALWAPEHLRRETICVPDALALGPQAYDAHLRTQL
ncbi:MAG: glutamyl-tRNA synthetase [Bradymonadia bacterium]|jgi:glutamyl-tRNA synthetase